MNGYHFTSNFLRDDQPIPPVGEWLEYNGPLVLCESGLHACEHPLDALKYAPGPLLHYVELLDCVNYEDKWIGRRRRIIASIDAINILKEFGRWCALGVIDLWGAPDIVHEYLITGDESLRFAANEAARAVKTADYTIKWAAKWAAICATKGDAIAANVAAWVTIRASDTADAADAANWAIGKSPEAQRRQFLTVCETAFAN